MSTTPDIDRQLSVAPMMDWTDRHCRYFHRLLAPSALLYTEMVTTGALLHGDHERFLAFNAEEHPLALQLGGSDPDELARCAQMAERWGYDEVNLNVGCPSDRVQKGRFGACLMKEPALVRDCLGAMLAAVKIPVTVKCRLGVDDLYSYEYFHQFVAEVMSSGAHALVAHARIALLEGLSPKENRDVPPLHHDWVYRLKREMPALSVSINGGINSLALVRQHLEQVDGVMIGRAAYQRPWLLAECQSSLYGPTTAPDSPQAVVADMSRYLERQVAAGVAVKHITRHVLGLFTGRPGARLWRRYIAEHAHLDDRNHRVLSEAFQHMRAATEAA